MKGYDHPPNKTEVARRLALQALHVAYASQTVAWTGPVMLRVEHADEGVRLHYASAAGLHLRDVRGANGGADDCTRCCDGAPPSRKHHGG